MKPISYGIIGLMVILSFFLIEDYKISQEKTYQMESHYMAMALENAVEDASESLRQSAHIYSATQGILNEIQPKIAIDTFFQSLGQTLGYTSIDDYALLSSYVPVIALVDDTGYYLYVSQPLDGDTTSDGYSYKKALLPKVTYSTKVGNHIIYFGKSISIITKVIKDGKDTIETKQYKNDGTLANQNYADDELDKFFKRPDYSSYVQQLKLEQLENALKYYTNAHNAYAKNRGITYHFEFAPINNEWTGAVNNPNILVLFQGMPFSNGHKIDTLIDYNIAVDKNDVLIGRIVNGVKYYCKSTCTAHRSFEIVKQFYNEQDAAKNGFYPCNECFY